MKILHSSFASGASAFILAIRYHLKNITVFLSVSLLITPLHVRADEKPDSVVRAFYQKKVAIAPIGLPSNATLGNASRFLSKDLVALIGQARAIEQKCARVTPSDTKPPIWEGSVFSGSTEGATRLTSAKARLLDGKTVVAIELVYIDKNFSVGHKYRSTTWTMDVELTKMGRTWLISDLVYEDGKHLSQLLLDYKTLKCGI